MAGVPPSDVTNDLLSTRLTLSLFGGQHFRGAVDGGRGGGGGWRGRGETELSP